jgi:hypothetical protein
MAAKPNFTDAQIIGDTVRVEGKSDDDVSDIIDIRVVLVQGKRIAGGSVDQISSGWKAELPVTDPAARSGDFRVGEAVAFGVETRSENLLTMTWTETVTIR